MSLVDTTLAPGPCVAQVQPGSTAQQAGVAPGDVLVSLNGKPVTRTRDVDQALSQASDEATIELEIQAQAGRKTIRLPVSSSPLLLPNHSRLILYNQALADLALLARSSEGIPKSAAQLNMAIGFMHFGEYQRALSDCLQGLSLPRESGISDGTVQYYIGECYRGLRSNAEATAAYQRASQSKESTLEFDGGLRVHAAARERLKELNP
jgi:membrane-associated protease RseP (regulator of RpoE activity)